MPRCFLFASIVPLLLLTLFVAPSAPSVGDRDPEFQQCLALCTASRCSEIAKSAPLDLSLRLTFWSCPSDCSYHCQHEVTQSRVNRGWPVLQYYGKWPFHRLLGAQEPASVVFSLLNGYGHYANRRRVASLPRDHPFRALMLLYCWCGMNVWLWSAVFHTRDVPWTEKADYFSAGLGILFSTAFAFARIAWITQPWSQILLLLLVTPLYIVHIGYLGFVKFDYGYNMMACVTVGILHSLLWLYWSFRARNRRTDWWVPSALCLAMSAAMSFELMDFPPIFSTIDAHSLWHAATIPMVWAWYRFWLKDARVVYGSLLVDGSGVAAPTAWPSPSSGKYAND